MEGIQTARFDDLGRDVDRAKNSLTVKNTSTWKLIDIIL